MNKSLILLALLSVTTFATILTIEDSVYVLTDSNFDEFIASKEFVLVEFYAPWCGHCKKLAPEYSKAAAALIQEKSKACLAKVDATEQKELASRFSISGFPTLKLFTRSVENPIEYNGARTEKDITGWIKKRTGFVSEVISTTEELKAFLSKHQVAIIYYGESESDADWTTFKTTALSYDELAFGHVFSSDLRASEGASGMSVVLYKQFDEGRNNFTGSLTIPNLKSFINEFSYPMVMPFNDRAIQKVFQQGNPTIFLFANEKEDSSSAEAAFAQAAKVHKGKVIFSISKPDDGFGHYQRLAEYVGVNTSLAPQIMLVHTTDDVKKYKFTSKHITLETISDFVTQYVNGRLSPYLKSEEPPAKNDEPVRVIVGKTYDEIVMNSTQDILLEFYAPWCGHCQQLSPIYETVAKKLKHNKNIVIAKIDSTANEVPGISIRGFPTIKFYPNGKKDSPIDFEGDRTEEGIMKYLKEKTTHPWMEAKDEL